MVALENEVIVVTGANRGIGFELVKQLAERSGNTIIATARDPAKAVDLKALGSNVDVTQLDTSDEASIETWADSLKEKYSHVDVLFNNAGIIAYTEFGQVTQEELIRIFRVNTAGPFLVTQALYTRGLIGGEKETVVAAVSSVLGSIASNADTLSALSAPHSFYSYSSSKAALNMITVNIADDFKDKGLVAVAIHPGLVATDMNNGERGIPPPESARLVLGVIESGKELQGKFYSYDGTPLPW